MCEKDAYARNSVQRASSAVVHESHAYATCMPILAIQYLPNLPHTSLFFLHKYPYRQCVRLPQASGSCVTNITTDRESMLYHRPPLSHHPVTPRSPRPPSKKRKKVNHIRKRYFLREISTLCDDGSLKPSFPIDPVAGSPWNQKKSCRSPRRPFVFVFSCGSLVPFGNTHGAYACAYACR